MNITKQNKATVEFGELLEGDVFLSDNSIYMKTEESYTSPNGDLSNAVDVATGELCYFFSYSYVQPVEHELIIK